MTMKGIPLVEGAVLCILDNYYFSLATDECTVRKIKRETQYLKKMGIQFTVKGFFD